MQVIRGKLERVWVLYDDIDVLEEEDLRDGYLSTFNVRIVLGGFHRSLGLWKIDVMQGKIVGIAESRESLNNPQPFELYEERLNQLRDEEMISRTFFYGPLGKMINNLSLEYIKSGKQLLSPTNYIRKAINSSIQKIFGEASGIEFTDDALSKLEERVSYLNKVFDSEETNQAKQAISRLANYCCIVRQGEKVSEKDVNDAANFYKAVLESVRKKFLPEERMWRLELIDSPLFTAFYNWRPFRRLPIRLRTPESLIALLIDFARIQYVLDNFPSKLDSQTKPYLERLNDEFIQK